MFAIHLFGSVMSFQHARLRHPSLTFAAATSFQHARLRHLSLTFAAPLPQVPLTLHPTALLQTFIDQFFPAPPSVPNIHGSAIQTNSFRLRLPSPTYTAPPSKHHLSGSATSFQHARLRYLSLTFAAPLPQMSVASAAGLLSLTVWPILSGSAFRPQHTRLRHPSTTFSAPSCLSNTHGSASAI